MILCGLVLVIEGDGMGENIAYRMLALYTFCF